MKLYLIQHGLALPKEQDPDEGLSVEGKYAISNTGKVLKKLGVSFDHILCSPKKRSRETAEILAGEMGFSKKIVESEKIKALTPTQETAEYMHTFMSKESVLIAGHLPSLSKLVAYFLCKTEDMDVAFRNGGCLSLEIEGAAGKSKLLWMLSPELIAQWL